MCSFLKCKIKLGMSLWASAYQHMKNDSLESSILYTKDLKTPDC